MDSNILQENIFFLAGALSRKLSKEADDAFATVGLSHSHALILVLVEADPGIQPSSVAEQLSLQPSTITRLVQKLERRQLVERESKGRATSIVCTAKGSNIAAEVRQKWEQLLADKKEQLGDRYVNVLAEMIENALEAMDSG
ncbi:MAG: MarR family transcriptional regulator [Fodinibius sp.]|nr:MarR family transcriptional regulator [Fodinibius sp.]